MNSAVTMRSQRTYTSHEPLFNEWQQDTMLILLMLAVFLYSDGLQRIGLR